MSPLSSKWIFNAVAWSSLALLISRGAGGEPESRPAAPNPLPAGSRPPWAGGKADSRDCRKDLVEFEAFLKEEGITAPVPPTCGPTPSDPPRPSSASCQTRRKIDYWIWKTIRPARLAWRFVPAVYRVVMIPRESPMRLGFFDFMEESSAIVYEPQQVLIAPAYEKLVHVPARKVPVHVRINSCKSAG